MVQRRQDKRCAYSIVTVPLSQGDLKAVFVRFCGGAPMFVRIVTTSPFWKARPWLSEVRTFVFCVAQSVVFIMKFRSYETVRLGSAKRACTYLIQSRNELISRGVRVVRWPEWLSIILDGVSLVI